MQLPLKISVVWRLLKLFKENLTTPSPKQSQITSHKWIPKIEHGRDHEVMLMRTWLFSQWLTQSAQFACKCTWSKIRSSKEKQKQTNNSSWILQPEQGTCRCTFRRYLWRDVGGEEGGAVDRSIASNAAVTLTRDDQNLAINHDRNYSENKTKRKTPSSMMSQMVRWRETT